MSTYLVGFIICNFNITKIGLYSLSIGIGSQPGTEGSRNWALITSMHLLNRHNQYFMVNYMLPKIDQLAIPGLVESAVDNWGLCTYSEDFLLFNEKMDSVFTKTSIAITISHQLANQWFGSYVTLDWWSYLWLKTGLATLYGYDAIDEVFNHWDIYQYFHVHAYQAALLQDGSNLLPSMSQNVERPEEIERMFDIISYGKSGAVLSMWRHALTDTVFRQGIQIYLEEYQLKAATESNFFEAIQKAIILEKYTIPKDFPSMMFSWTTTPSYPLLTVKRNYDDNSFIVYQKAFSNNGSSNDYLKWFIPLNFATKSNFDFRSARATHFMLDKMKSYVPDVKVNKHEWLLLNKQSTGYYRINYDQRNWYLLAAGLKEETYKFHPRNRAQLIDDSYQLSISHELNNKIFLEILSYLPNESEYAPWETARAILTKMNLVMLGNKQYKVFRNFVAGLVLKVFKELGFTEIPGEKHFQKITRACVIELACMIDLDGCLKQSSRMVYSYLEGDIENIDPNLQKVIYCNGLKTATDYLFDAYVRILMTTNDQNERKNLIGSLGCSQNVEHWNQLLGSTIIDKAGILTEDECSALLAPIYSLSDAGLRTTITFIAKSIQSFSKPCRDAMLKIIPDIANYIVNKEQSNLFAILITEVFRTKEVPFDLIQDSLKTTEENIRRSMNVESIFENMEEDKPVDEKDSKTIMHVPSISLLFTMFVISH